MDMLLHNYVTSGWSLHGSGGNRQKLVINFDLCDTNLDNGGTCVEQIQYKRKTPKQIQRDTDRARNYACKKIAHTSDNLPATTRQTRSQTKDLVDKECPRSEDISIEQSHELCPNQSAIELEHINDQVQSPKVDNNCSISVDMTSPVVAPSRPEVEPAATVIPPTQALMPVRSKQTLSDIDLEPQTFPDLETANLLCNNAESYTFQEHPNGTTSKCQYCNDLLCSICMHYHKEACKEPFPLYS